MNKVFLPLLFLSLVLSAFVFAGCSDKEAEAEIARLTQENAALQNSADSLQHTLDSLNRYADSVKKSLEKLDMDR